MAKVAVEHVFTGATQGITGVAYDPTKTLLGTLMRQKTGQNTTDNFVGPAPILVGRPIEQSTSAYFPVVYPWSSRFNWIFLADGVAAAATRRITMYMHDKDNDSLAYKGYIIMNYTVVVGNRYIRGMRVMVTRHTDGTITTAGTTTVTGSGTKFQADRIAVGARIGFGTTDPTQVTNWYEIGGISADGTLTTTVIPPTYSGATTYVIEELRIVVAIVNSSTATNGGLYVIKGLRPEIFTPTGLNIGEGSATDNLRVIYWLADASTVTNTSPAGLAIDDVITPTQHFAYVIDTSGPKVYKYNLRASLASLSGGKSTSSWVLTTGSQTPTITGTVQQNNNGRIATMGTGGGPGAGLKCLYFATTTRIYRALESNIFQGNLTWINDAMIEIPTGSVSTIPAPGAMYSVDYSDAIDRLMVSTNATRVYVTQYNTISQPFDHTILVDSKQQDSSLADSSTVPYPNTIALPMMIWTESGFAYIVRVSTAQGTNIMYITPFSADWQYAASTLHRVITPAINTPNITKHYRVYVNNAKYLGSGALTMPTEPFRIYARTSGITDNSGTWGNPIGDDGNISYLGATTQIQFMLEFRTLGPLMIPARVYSITSVYEDNANDSHYQPSVKWSDITNKRFAWRFATGFGTAVPTLYVRLYDAVTGNLLLLDDTATHVGTFEKTTNDGGLWGNYDTTDLTGGNTTTYIRYTPASLGDNIKVKAVISQA